jgi:hypothetical protein
MRQDGSFEVVPLRRYDQLKDRGKIQQTATGLDQYVKGFDPDAPEPKARMRGSKPRSIPLPGAALLLMSRFELRTAGETLRCLLNVRKATVHARAHSGVWARAVAWTTSNIFRLAHQRALRALPFLPLALPPGPKVKSRSTMDGLMVMRGPALLSSISRGVELHVSFRLFVRGRGHRFTSPM